MTHFQATAGANANGSWCRRCCSCSVGGSARREPLSVCLCYRNPFGCGKPSPLPRNLCPVPNPINGHRGKKERAASVYQRRGENKKFNRLRRSPIYRIIALVLRSSPLAEDGHGRGGSPQTVFRNNVCVVWEHWRFSDETRQRRSNAIGRLNSGYGVAGRRRVIYFEKIRPLSPLPRL